MRAKAALGIVAGATLAAALWWRKNPSACPYGQRFWVEAPHPIISRARLRTVLAPQPGERVLEIGPGTGYYTLDLAEWVGPDGGVEIFDLQREFLDHVMRLAGERGLANVTPTQGDATALPFEDDSIDAVVLTAVLGEIPDTARRPARDPPRPAPGRPPGRRRALRRPALHHPGEPQTPSRRSGPPLGGPLRRLARLLRPALSDLRTLRAGTISLAWKGSHRDR